MICFPARRGVARLKRLAAVAAGAAMIFGATSTSAAAALQALTRTGDIATLRAFDASGTQIGGGIHLYQFGDTLGFNDVGAALYAPDGTLQVLSRSGAVTASLRSFDATGNQTAQIFLNNLGDTYGIGDVGSVFYAPDGTLQALTRTGPVATLRSFDATGTEIGKLNLNQFGDTFGFADIGSVFYAPDGTLQALTRSGAATASLTSFDATGTRTAQIHLHSAGDTLAFADVGAVFYTPDGTLRAVVRSGGILAALASFDATGAQTGGVYFNNLGDTYGFGDIGAVLYTPNVWSPPGGVPEPATWAMMILGFGMAGAVMRGRRLAEA